MYLKDKLIGLAKKVLALEIDILGFWPKISKEIFKYYSGIVYTIIMGINSLCKLSMNPDSLWVKGKMDLPIYSAHIGDILLI